MHPSDIQHVPGYTHLSDVFARAYQQAALGKGAERHADNRPFTEQPMQTISDLLGNHQGLLYQAMKKIQESNRLDTDAAVRELLGAINYIAGAVIHMEKKQTEIDLGPSEATKELLDRAAHWTCGHGSTSGPTIVVPIGESCPVCHAIA